MVEETKIEETNENPGEEETPVEEPQTEPEETPEETPQEESVPQETDKPKYTDREKQYYARMKKAEDDAKKLKVDLEKAKKAPTPDMSDIDVVLEVQQATKGLSTEEVVELKARALILDVPLSEARKDVNFTLWQSAWKEKVEKQKQALTPSNKQAEQEKPKTLVEKLRAAKTIEEKEKLLTESGRYKSPRPRSVSPMKYDIPA